MLPRRVGLSVVALVAVVSLATISPASAVWLVGTSLAVALTITLVRAKRYRGVAAAILCIILTVLLLASRETIGIFWVGGAYFTLRHIHVLIEWWMDRLRVPTIREYLRYSLFLPVLMAGPIHRLDNFQRQERRQRLNAVSLFCGAERALLGLAQAVVIPGGLRWLQRIMQAHTDKWETFSQRWIEGTVDWLLIYFSFAGLTSVAVGLSLMMGLRIEENFNRPWAAKNLIDFWSRWHMTLSHWCRDYVFQTITAVSRRPALGLVMAMLAMGIWHDTSVYYVLWAMWQSLGILLTHLALKSRPIPISGATAHVTGVLSVYLWLSLTRPVILQVMDQLPS